MVSAGEGSDVRRFQKCAVALVCLIHGGWRLAAKYFLVCANDKMRIRMFRHESAELVLLEVRIANDGLGIRR